MPKKVSIQNDNEILNNIFHLLEVKGVRQKDLAEYLGISKTAITQWKINKTNSYMNYIEKIASFFDVSQDEILHPQKDLLHDTLLSPDEMEIIRQYRSLHNSEIKRHLTSVISTLVNYYTLEPS